MRSPLATILASLVLTGLLTLNVAGHAPDSNANCDVALEADEADVTVVLPEGMATIYVNTPADGLPEVWLESNDYEGLQTHEHVCRTNPGHLETTVAADTRLL